MFSRSDTSVGTESNWRPSAALKPRWAWAILALFVAVHSGLLAYSGYVHSPTVNEPAHLAAGISHWQLGEFGLYRVNPPLVRMVASLPVLLAGVKTDWHRLHQDPTARPDFVVGDDLIAANGERSFFLFTIARWACIPFSWLAGIVCFLWARDLYGPLAGVMAATLWCFSPNILAHGSLITPDAHATALGLAACYTFWGWLRRPTWRRAIVTGIVLGVAELTKTTFVFLYPLFPLVWLFYRFSDQAKMLARRWAQETGMLLSWVMASIFVINLGYGFSGSFTTLGDFQFVSSTFTGEVSGTLGNRFADTWLGSAPVPFPKDYVLGIDVQRRDFEYFGRPSFLAGEFKDTGWWYYMPLIIVNRLLDWFLKTTGDLFDEPCFLTFDGSKNLCELCLGGSFVGAERNAAALPVGIVIVPVPFIRPPWR